MGRYVLGFEEIDQTQVAAIGGKAAPLGELSRLEGISVPAGFCVTTVAFRRVVAGAPTIADLLERLSRLTQDDRGRSSALSGEIRLNLEAVGVPDDVEDGVIGALGQLGEHAAYAVRSSATAEDSADDILRGPAGHLPEHRWADGDSPAPQPLLGLAFHRALGDLPAAKRHRPPAG